MYKVVRVLNHNTVIAALDDCEKLHGKENLLDKEDKYLLMGKGIGFGKKTGAAAELKEDSRVYSLRNVVREVMQRILLTKLHLSILKQRI